MQPDILVVGAIALLCLLALLVWNSWILTKLVGSATHRLYALEQERSLSEKGVGERVETGGASETGEASDADDVSAGHSAPARMPPSSATDLESLAAERDELLAVEERLTAQLRQAQLEGQENSQLYLLMKGLLDRHELLTAARVGAKSVTQSDSSKKPAKPPAVVKPKSVASAARSRTSEDLGPFVDDKEHQKAARMARVMVADLFLYNPKAAEEGIAEDELRSRLKVSYRAARETYESRVADRVRKEKDYLDMEFERAVKKRTGGPQEKPMESVHDAPAEEVEEPSGEDEEHHRAARLARLMIADLFLANWGLVEKGIHEGNLRELLDPAFQETRRTFESQVAESVWDETHYFDVHFEQLLWESQAHLLDSEFDRALQARLVSHGAAAPAGR